MSKPGASETRVSRIFQFEDRSLSAVATTSKKSYRFGLSLFGVGLPTCRRRCIVRVFPISYLHIPHVRSDSRACRNYKFRSGGALRRCTRAPHLSACEFGTHIALSNCHPGILFSFLSISLPESHVSTQSRHRLHPLSPPNLVVPALTVASLSKYSPMDRDPANWDNGRLHRLSKLAISDFIEYVSVGRIILCALMFSPTVFGANGSQCVHCSLADRLPDSSCSGSKMPPTS